ncbi:cysteine proteinase [Epithele typhae]|uniref:cysteine proteinase n=1 Tax=Epithele typhae TaxID=378194 RepID=UPI002007A4EB|nr:cysteine proteinase [Epithele typhae]KAH9928561.1 cysteine proteinase [Epithele typhae]
MASPHTPYHPQPGPSYYQHPPPPPQPPHYGYAPAPGPAPYYAYPMPPMNGHAPMHQPASPRISGGGRGRYPHRGGGPAYHYQPVPHQHMPPPTMSVQTPPPLSPASPFHHPQKFQPHPHAHQVPYGSPYHHPQPTPHYPHTWQGQAPSPVPKQLTALPPMLIQEHPQLHPPQPPPNAQPQPLPDMRLVPIPPSAPISDDAARIPSPIVQPLLQPIPASQPQHSPPEIPQEETPPEEPAVVNQPEESEPEPQQAEEPTVQAVANSPESEMPNSPTDAPPSFTAIASTFVIWSRRPENPSLAPGVIISPRAFPPENVVQRALELRTPPASPKVQRIALPQPSIPVPGDVEGSPELAGELSSSTTETTPSGSLAADTPVPGSPYSCATSVSAAVEPSAPKVQVTPLADAQTEQVSTTPEIMEPTTPQLTSATSAALAAPAAPVPVTPAPAIPAPPPKPKSWAALLQSDSTASSSKPRLPVSNVVGFSIPATSGGSSSPHPGGSVGAANRNELLRLINEGPSSSTANLAAAMKIRPRGLVNTGNMCFANAVLQILVYCPPFHRFFSELRKHLSGPVVGSQREGSKATPLVDATIQFMKEFVPDPPAHAADSRSKGKERDDDAFDELDSFIPTYVYDAMKEKKRFANMIGGHQEDAEEFLGFYLDTLEEELLSIAQSLQPKEPAKASEEESVQDDGWMEVGKKNKAVTTRTAKSTDSPITRIFGGKFRSILQTPHQRDSVTIEDWRSLQLDIQPQDVTSLRDAIRHISQPQTVQISIPTRPGVVLDAKQQVLIDALPPVLILHMKRFLYDTKVGDVVKVGKQVSFSAELDIPLGRKIPALRRPIPPRALRLGGHYTLDVLHPNRELSDRPRPAWIRIDDELVSDVMPQDVFGGQEREDRQPYLLFYRRLAAWGAART